MKRTNKILFHISRENKWKIGDIITSGTQENPFWTKCKTFSCYPNINGEVMSMFTMFEKFPKLDLTQANLEYIYELLKNVSKEMAFYIREQVFEDVREEFYPQLPSRQKCLWLSDEEQLSYWKTINISELQWLLTLELQGNIFCGDAYWLRADTLSSIEYIDRAKRYWSGEISNVPRKEYLFSGQAIINEITQIL